MLTTYRVSTYDPGDEPDDDWGWTVRWSGLPAWMIRAAVRQALSMGYERQVSILVEREDSAC